MAGDAPEPVVKDTPGAEAPAAAPPVAGEPRVCWGCGAAEPVGKTFQTCARCREDGLTPPSPFCSKDCLKASWPRHKAWHAEMKKAGHTDADGMAAKELATVHTLRNVLKDKPDSDAKTYMNLLMEADELKLRGSYTKAESLLHKAIKQNAQNPIAYAALGEISGLTNKPHAAAGYYVKAVELFPKEASTEQTSTQHGKNVWASSMLSAIFWLNVPGGKPEDQPEWFNDSELKETTANLIQLAPGDLRSWQTRAFVLCPMPDMPPQWKMPPGGMMRSEQELQEAGRCWQRVMEMTPGGREEKRPFVARAAHCFRTAQVVAEHVKAQQADADAKAAEMEKEAAIDARQNEVVPAW